MGFLYYVSFQVSEMPTKCLYTAIAMFGLMKADHYMGIFENLQLEVFSEYFHLP